jgi:predicted AAA+ superfamily ATPase
MFARQLLSELEKWRLNKPRKPLIIRGARQVGKTTLVNQFAKQYEQYIYLNLELAEDK